MTDLNLDELERICNAATEGPWEWLADGTYRLVTTHSGRIHVMRFCRMGFNEAQPMFREGHKITPAKKLDIYNHPDAQFIAASRAALPALIAEVRRLRARDIPAKVNMSGFAPECPSCGRQAIEEPQPKYCPDCGQKFKWSR